MEEKKYQACVLLNRRTKLCLILIPDEMHGELQVRCDPIKQVAVGAFRNKTNETFEPGREVMEYYQQAIHSAIQSGYHAVWRSFSALPHEIFGAAKQECGMFCYRNKDLMVVPTQWFNNGRPSPRGTK